MPSGLDRIAAGLVPDLVGQRVAVLCNHTATDARGQHIIPVLRAAGATVVRALAPEHGLWSTHQDMEPVLLDGYPRDPLLDVPVVSLYGDHYDSLEPSPDALAGVDAIVYDIRDIGTRYYTYAATLAFTMKVAARISLPVWVCDRPNLLGARREGPLLEPGFESFCGIVPGLPVRHGMDMGTLARWYKARLAPDADLRIIAPFDAGPDPWVWPSPNMPTPRTALVYPGMCLLEGTTLSEGRGTTTPFLMFGAPELDSTRVVDDLCSRNLPGVRFLRTRFRPAFGKHAGRINNGIWIDVVDPDIVPTVALGVHVLDACRRASPEAWTWRTDAYEFVADRHAIDLLWGSPALRLCLDAGDDVGPLLRKADAAATTFDPNV
jgi:uncharacterized protein YbbC (DUF1343 family)